MSFIYYGEYFKFIATLGTYRVMIHMELKLLTNNDSFATNNISNIIS